MSSSNVKPYVDITYWSFFFQCNDCHTSRTHYTKNKQTNKQTNKQNT